VVERREWQEIASTEEESLPYIRIARGVSARLFAERELYRIGRSRTMVLALVATVAASGAGAYLAWYLAPKGVMSSPSHLALTSPLTGLSLFVFVMAYAFGSHVAWREFRSPLFPEVAATPTQPADVLVGKTLAAVLIGLILTAATLPGLVLVCVFSGYSVLLAALLAGLAPSAVLGGVWGVGACLRRRQRTFILLFVVIAISWLVFGGIYVVVLSSSSTHGYQATFVFYLIFGHPVTAAVAAVHHPLVLAVALPWCLAIAYLWAVSIANAAKRAEGEEIIYAQPIVDRFRGRPWFVRARQATGSGATLAGAAKPPPHSDDASESPWQEKPEGATGSPGPEAEQPPKRPWYVRGRAADRAAGIENEDESPLLAFERRHGWSMRWGILPVLAVEGFILLIGIPAVRHGPLHGRPDAWMALICCPLILQTSLAAAASCWWAVRRHVEAGTWPEILVTQLSPRDYTEGLAWPALEAMWFCPVLVGVAVLVALSIGMIGFMAALCIILIAFAEPYGWAVLASAHARSLEDPAWQRRKFLDSAFPFYIYIYGWWIPSTGPWSIARAISPPAAIAMGAARGTGYHDGLGILVLSAAIYVTFAVWMSAKHLRSYIS
jgi:hypothetical protein